MIQLKSLTVTDFRSIRGSLTVPLDAPVVLIHGQNGTGKTSLLAGMELALTGDVASLSRIDRHYREHLLHKESRSGQVSLEVAGLTDEPLQGAFRIGRHGVEGRRVLDEQEARFYDERCFLAQATLGRLLEIYEATDARNTDSPLTRFVKDLLGLNHLDALIEGLHDAGDVRRFRSTVPMYWESRENIPALQKQLEREQTALTALNEEHAECMRQLGAEVKIVGLVLPDPSDLAALSNQLGEAPEEAELQRLATQRREFSALRTQWESVSSGVDAEVRARIEAQSAADTAALHRWKDTDGKTLEEVLAIARGIFTSLPLVGRESPQAVLIAAIELTQAEIDHCVAALAQVARDEKQWADLDSEIERAMARAQALEHQISQHSAEGGPLARVLNEILPHVRDQECPVCGRNFGEISTRPLHAHVLARIGQLSQSAGQLEALFREKTETASALSNAERARAVVNGRRLEPKAHDELKTREADLKELRERLVALTARAQQGYALTVAATAAASAVATLESQDLRASAVRDSIAQAEREFSLDLAGPTDSLTAALDRLDAMVVQRTTLLLSRQTARRGASEHAREAAQLHVRRAAAQQTIQGLRKRIDRLKGGQEAADALIHDARELGKRARAARTETVRRVFNDALNSVWKDLFVRLAPEELFVPAFALPEDDGGPVEATLETHYKTVGKGGNPRAMLSAGNLNTAALTLFLALHLSVAPTLPWLVIDDPIQSMDEVHIAQLAALLRTLSKAHHRQVIIAVHEKPLFDYLALELSPAFPTDRLITIELSRSASGETLMRYEPRVWKPDTAIAA